MMASMVFGYLVRQVWPPLSYKIRYIEISTSVGGLPAGLERQTGGTLTTCRSPTSRSPTALKRADRWKQIRCLHFFEQVKL